MLMTNEIPAILNQLEAWKAEHSAALRPELRSRILDLSFNSPVDTIVKTAETLYAAKGEVGDAGKQMLAELFYTASYHGWHGVNTDGRVGRIMAGVRRDLGEDTPVMGWPAPEDDPEPKPEYVVAVPDAADVPTPAA